MAAAFNLTAQINLQGPTNLKPIVSNIQKQINGAKIKLNLDVGANSAKNITSITTRLNSLAKAATNANTNVASLSATLSTLSRSFGAASSTASGNATAVTQTSKAVASAGKAVQQTRTQIEEFGKQAGLAVKRFAAFSTVTAPIYALTNAISGAFKEFVNFNKEIVRLSQVTGQSVSDLTSVSKEITRLSTSLGVASSDLLTVATTLAQAGLSAEDTKIALEALAKSALAPSFESLTDTTEGAIAALRQFGLQTRELDSALGSINSVAAAFAVEAGDIITAIQRTGGVFSAASRGVSEGTDALNEFIAIFTSVRATTRESAETIATGLRTIFTRIQRVKTIEQLREFGIELQDAEGKFVGLYEATRRLSEGLSKIDPRSAGFATISEELGGFRQIGKVIPLIQQFAVAEKALSVAQKGVGSTSKDALIAQQSLAVQFSKTRENFLALVREIGESASFKAFVGVSLTLANAFISLGRSLKPLLPLLLTFASIKAGGALREFGGGFGGVFGLGGGGGAGPAPAAGGGGGGGRGAGAGANATSAIVSNTNILNAVSQTLNALNVSILALNQNIVNTNSLLLNRPTKGFATGGLVPGSGNSDTFRANLTPGEFVIRKKAVETIGASNLARMNSGGLVQQFKRGSKGQGVKDLEPSPTETPEAKILQQIFGKINSRGYVPYTAKTKAGLQLSEEKLSRELKPADILKSKSLQSLSGTTGFSVDSLSEAQKKLKSLKTGNIATARAQSLQEKISKQTALDAGKVLEFGLVGLRYGAKGADSLTEFRVPIPPGFTMDIENIKNIPDSSQLVRVRSATVSEKAGPEVAKDMQTILMNNFKQSVIEIGSKLGSRIGTGIEPNTTLINEAVNNSDFFNVIGAGIEAALGTLGAPIIPKTQGSKSIDFPKGLGDQVGGFFGIPPNIPTDVTRTIGGEGKNLGSSGYLGQIERWLKTEEGARYLTKFQATRGYATGGSVSDTVPALLTPGEFVVNKASAQRIGYGTLNRLNKADKIKGFNKGGVVGYQGGGVVDMVGGNAGAIAAITAVILPEMEKLADSFKKLGGESSSLAAGLSGAAKEASSLVLSAGIALRTLGASRKATGITQGVVGVGGAISGFITEKTAKDLEKALLKTSEQFGKFDKNLQDLTQAPTEELRIKAAADLEKSFGELGLSVRSSIENLDNTERLQNFGNSLSNVTTAVITSIAAMSALSLATKAQTAAAQAEVAKRLAIKANPFTSGVSLAPLALGTRFLATFGKFIPYIGLLIGAISVATEAFGLFTNNLKKSGEQFDRLYNALLETTKNSNAYNLANQNFIKNILPQFRDIRGRSKNTEQLKETLGTIRTDNGFNELNLLFKTLLRSKFAEKNIIFDENENISDFQRQMSTSAAGLKLFEQVVKETSQEFEREQFIRAKRANNPDITRSAASQEFDRLLKIGKLGIDEINRTVGTFVGAENLATLSLRDLTDANNRVKISLVNLDNILVSLSAKITSSIDKAINSFDDLDLRISTLRGEPEPIGGRFLRRDIAVLENIGGATEKQINDITNTVRGLINITPGAPGAKQFDEIATQVQAVRTFQQDLPAVLRQIQSQPEGGIDTTKISDVLKERLGPQLLRISGGQQNVVDTILTDAAAQLNQAIAGNKESITSLDDLARNAPALAAALKNGETSVQAYKGALDAAAKLQDKLADQQKRLIDLNNDLNQTLIQRKQVELQNALELKRILGENITLKELNDVFDTGIKQLTNVGGRIPAGGTTDVGTISAQLAKSKDYIQTLDEQIALTRNDQQITKELTDDRTRESIVVNRLNQALSTLATSGEKTKNALDKISESQNKFKTQRDIFFDFVRNARNPEAFVEQRQVIESIKAARSGRFRNIEQALLFQEKGAAILKGFQPEANVDILLNAAAQYITRQTRGTNIVDTAMKAYVDSVFGTGGKNVALDKQLQAAQKEQKDAANATADSIREQIGVVTDTTESIFKTFNNDLGLILPGIITNLDRLNTQTSAKLDNRFNQSFRPSAGLAAKIQEKIITRPGMTPEEARYDAPQLAVSDFLKAGPLADTTRLQTILKQNPEVALKTISDELIKESDKQIKLFGFINADLANARLVIQQLQNDLNREREAYKESAPSKMTFPGEKNRYRDYKYQPSNPRLNRTAPINDGASIQRFENSANALSKSLNEAPLQNLSDSIGSFNTTATQLVSALKDFTSKFQDGMKGEIAYTGDINIGFNEELSVNIPNSSANRNNLITDIDNRLRSTIGTSVSKAIQSATMGS